MTAATDSPLLDEVRQIAADVVLATTGRSVELEADAPLWQRRGPLDPLDRTHLVLALQQRLGVTFARHEIEPTALATPRAIAAIVARHRDRV